MPHPQRATPLAIVESYFNVSLGRSGLKKLDRVSHDRWVDFGHHYVDAMSEHFAAEVLTVADGTSPVRLFFEPRLSHEWDRAVRTLHQPTPLLGVQTDPDPDVAIDERSASAMLGPLKKHLLVADSVFVRDTFFKVFDTMAESVTAGGWRDDVTATQIVELSVGRIKRWLPLLAQLRPLIESQALVFMPYDATPSFPFAAGSPALAEQLERVRARDAPWYHPEKAPAAVDFEHFLEPPALTERSDEPDPVAARRWIDHDEVLGAWLNARILGLDPVYPNRPMFDVAAGYYFEDETGPDSITSDLISMDVLPFGDTKELGLKELASMRKNERVFTEVRQTAGRLKSYLDDNVATGTSGDAITRLSREYLHDELAGLERRSVLRFLDESKPAGIGYSLAFGALFLPAVPVLGSLAPAIPLIAGAVATPSIARLVKTRFNRKARAIGHLQALL